MSQENVEVVRALYEAWNGPNGRHAALVFIADDFEWVNPSYAVEPGTRHGHEGWSAAMDSLEDAFHGGGHQEPSLAVTEALRTSACPGRTWSRSIAAIEFRDLGHRVLCFTTFIAKTSPDGVAVTQDEQHLWTLRDRKVVRFEWFHDRQEAIEAVGLSE